MNPELPAPQLPVSRYKLVFIAKDPIFFNDYPGAKWRGMLGQKFRQNACTTRIKYCNHCPKKFSCSYSYVFNSFVPPWSKKMRKYDQAPHPYILKPDISQQNIYPGENIHVMLHLFGDANQHLGDILKSFNQAALSGMTRLRKRMRLMEVYELHAASDEGREIWSHGLISPATTRSPVEIPPFEQKTLRLNIETPLRFQQGSKEKVDKNQIQFSQLFGSLLRRCSMLTYFYTQTPLQTDFAGLTQQAKSIRIQRRVLTDYRCGRYSKKEQQWVDKSGYIGFIDLPATRLEPFWPYLWLGQYTHAGNGTTIGMGGYSISWI